MIDVSTLGKLLVQGPDAARFLERLYPNRFGDMKVGRIRYGVLGTDAGRIMDDGTIARLGEEQYYVTTTSTGADAVIEWFEWLNAVWGLDVETVNLTGALAAVKHRRAPLAELLGRLADVDASNEHISDLDAKEAFVAGVPCLILRIGFVGELGYELHFPALRRIPVGRAARVRRGSGHPSLRARTAADPASREDAHPRRPGHRFRVERPGGGMPWIAKLDKDDFVGKWALEHVQERGFPGAARRLRDDRRRRTGRGRSDRARRPPCRGASPAPA